MERAYESLGMGCALSLYRVALSERLESSSWYSGSVPGQIIEECPLNMDWQVRDISIKSNVSLVVQASCSR